MKRKIIRIDEDKCNGCGQCVPNCPEGALQIVGGKARVVHEFSCDGLGACIGHCPLGAIAIEERDAEVYNERRAMENIVTQGPEIIRAHLNHLKEHRQTDDYREAVAYLNEKNIPVPAEPPCAPGGGGCPGSRMVDLTQTARPKTNQESDTRHRPASELRQWPVQLALVNPQAPYFRGADLLIAADCVPFAFGNFHQRFLEGKVVIVFCPKLDTGIDMYIDKLTEILSLNDIKSVTVTRMEVPCCGGVTRVLEEALQRSGKNVIIKEYTISLNGDII